MTSAYNNGILFLNMHGNETGWPYRVKDGTAVKKKNIF
jgi:hypothetical protein